MTRRRLALGAVLVCLSLAVAEEQRGTVSWSGLAKEGKVVQVTVLPGDTQQFERLRIVNPVSQALVVPLVTLEKPGVAGPLYAFQGQVRYENIEGTGYFEMWSFFPDGGHYFSRTLGDAGLMQALTGSSDWRPVAAPFLPAKGSPSPTRITLSLVLPGKGTVEVGPLRLVQYPEADLQKVRPEIPAPAGGSPGGAGGSDTNR
jgi:hypothetical protein